MPKPVNVEELIDYLLQQDAVSPVALTADDAEDPDDAVLLDVALETIEENRVESDDLDPEEEDR